MRFCCVAVDRIHGGLVELLAAAQPSGAWIRQEQGRLGLGVAAQTSASGADRFADLAHWWDSLSWQGPSLDGLPAGAGPTAFSSITYSSDSSSASRLILPELILAVTEQGTWLTGVVVSEPESGSAEKPAAEGFPLDQLLQKHGLRLDDGALSALSASPAAVPQAQLHAGTHPEQHYMDAVEAGVAAIGERRLEKLVLARDAVAAAEAPLPPGPLLARLTRDYSDCWTYRAGDVLGATPEMLVQVRGEELFARVLAGTVDRSLGEQGARVQLVENPKQRNEHTLAVESLLEQLAPVSAQLRAQTPPAVLELPNVYHLSTDVTGRLSTAEEGAEPISPLLVAERAHPTAAICGTPTATAAGLIGALEDIDRGPFSGPVGWVDTRGNADVGIALRGGVLENEDRQLRLYAGCGIVAGSEPASELAETWAKMRPMLGALGLKR
ncbi:isochorismate synthase [Nesterenkonia cremea]|uniref:Isochorismate synthase n=2 Tax=Nesterenkonia cremea TaxID=1882340 RepID=A0A917ARJ6_9MICC|nr:isochorismate synthase [Nesterenkonia cremea]